MFPSLFPFFLSAHKSQLQLLPTSLQGVLRSVSFLVVVLIVNLMNASDYKNIIVSETNNLNAGVSMSSESSELVMENIKRKTGEKTLFTNRHIALAPTIKQGTDNNSGNLHMLWALVDGDNLFVSFVGEDDYEICYWFCYTMENKLYSFHRVGSRIATTDPPSPETIVNGIGITWLNMTTSDNIGPLNMSVGGWIGGNHLVNGTRTAITRNVTIKADNTPISAASGLVKCSVVNIDVENDILDPSSKLTSEGIFGKTMLTERVSYCVVRNSIEVSVVHSFAQDVNNRVATYYGMQSMFRGEDKIMTPHGPYADFTLKDSVKSFDYPDYPTFNRFIEMNTANGWCQASFLLPEGIGDHRYVGNNNTFVTSTYGKNYHVLIRQLPVTGGTTYMWNGVYSWFRPLVNDDDVLLYTSILNGEEVLFVDIKRECDIAFALPDRWAGFGKRVSVLQADDGLKIDVVNSQYVRLTASSAGTVILSQIIVGDVNGDGMVSGTDVTALYNKLLSDIEPKGNADVNGDGMVNGADVTALYEILLGGE